MSGDMLSQKGANVASEVDGGPLTLLKAETAVESGVLAETSCDSPRGPYRFQIRVMPSVREAGNLLSQFAVSRDKQDLWPSDALATPYARHLPQVERLHTPKMPGQERTPNRNCVVQG